MAFKKREAEVRSESQKPPLTTHSGHQRLAGCYVRADEMSGFNYVLGIIRLGILSQEIDSRKTS